MGDRSNKRLKGPEGNQLEDRRSSPYVTPHPTQQQRYSSAPYGSHAPPGYAWPHQYNGQGPSGPPGSGHPHPGPSGVPGGPPPPHWAQVGGYGPPSRTPPPMDHGSWPPSGSGPYPRSRKPKTNHREDEMEGPAPRYWSGGPPPGGSPPTHIPPGPYRRDAPPGYWQQPNRVYPSAPNGWSKSSSRGPPRQDMMAPYPPGRGEEMGYMTTMTIKQPSQPSFYDEDGAESSAGESGKDKGRGSYKCGRCGVPKKGHVCPYQAKVKRRPDEPPPETRNAAVQVERDEFMTLRRLNIRIQGFPESYVTEPYMGESMVVGEVNPMSIGPVSHSHPDELLLSDRMIVPTSSPRTTGPPDMPSSSPLPPTATSALHPVDSSDMKGTVDRQTI
ncbi:hypothetical protein FisN_4Hh464 [Fistulifera solaris]|uniref:Uncharacterized protein n=1 Tax=Fistulifera solaris TaxID=1519565 RepID=A0A1Z5KIJ4_FISSO|nr:hypothetical protein FisN_4Hh464 [Fistulifera solaris]|eukprot:GAX26037.1 hypothetical protein FisN_4Hh464 [Fistulifera solaris]